MPRSTWGTSRVLPDFVYRTFTFCSVLSQTLLLSFGNPTSRPRNPPMLSCESKNKGLDFSLFARRYWGNPLRFLFLELLRCFNSLRVAPCLYGFKTRSFATMRSGLSHSEISGSRPVCDSPEHIAAYHVLHRLSLPKSFFIDPL